jgi:hypothetical protein
MWSLVKSVKGSRINKRRILGGPPGSGEKD